MISFIAQRIAKAIVVLLALVVLNFFLIRLAYCVATDIDTRTLPPASPARLTSLTRPICTPASRTVAPSTRPPTWTKSA